MGSKVERTKPGSKLDFRVTYDTGSKKWTNDRPGDGKGDPEEREELFDDLTVKRGIERLERAVSAYAAGKGEKGIQNAVEHLEQYAGVDAARTVVRAIYKAVKGNDDKIEKGVAIAKDHVNRGRKKDAMNPAVELLKIARELIEFPANGLKRADSVHGIFWPSDIEVAAKRARLRYTGKVQETRLGGGAKTYYIGVPGMRVTRSNSATIQVFVPLDDSPAEVKSSDSDIRSIRGIRNLSGLISALKKMKAEMIGSQEEPS